MSDLHQIFNEFNLTVNKEKISIDLFPFENFYDFNSKFNNMIKENGTNTLLRYEIYINKYIPAAILDYNQLYNKKDEMTKFYRILKNVHVDFNKNK